jgi:hypothetical protein
MNDLIQNPFGAFEGQSSSKAFRAIWGEKAEKGYFVMVPHDLLRNLSRLQLKPAEAIVLFCILSVGNGYCSASKISDWSGISVGTVRRCFRSLEKKDMVRRIYEKGEANKFDCRGLRGYVAVMAENRERDRYFRDRGLRIVDDDPV